MEANEIRFSAGNKEQILKGNTGKLNNRVFTTLRPHNESRYQVGNKYKIFLNDEYRGTATLKGKRTFRISEINEFISYIDAGCSPQELKEMLTEIYKRSNIHTFKWDFLLLVREGYVWP